MVMAMKRPPSIRACRHAAAQLGYKAYPFTRSREEEIEAAQTSDLLKRLGVAAFATMNIMLLSVSVWSGNVADIDTETRDLFHWISAADRDPDRGLFRHSPSFGGALRSLKARALGMDVPISLGVLLAVGISIVETMNSAKTRLFRRRDHGCSPSCSPGGCSTRSCARRPAPWPAICSPCAARTGAAA